MFPTNNLLVWDSFRKSLKRCKFNLFDFFFSNLFLKKKQAFLHWKRLLQHWKMRTNGRVIQLHCASVSAHINVCCWMKFTFNYVPLSSALLIFRIALCPRSLNRNILIFTQMSDAYSEALVCRARWKILLKECHQSPQSPCIFPGFFLNLFLSSCRNLESQKCCYSFQNIYFPSMKNRFLSEAIWSWKTCFHCVRSWWSG